MNTVAINHCAIEWIEVLVVYMHLTVAKFTIFILFR